MIAAKPSQFPALGLNALPTGANRLCAIAFDLVVEELRTHYSAASPDNAYAEVRAILEDEGFAWRQGSVYFGDPARVSAVACVLAAQRLATELPWFSQCVRDIRMLRIEENNDLAEALATPAPALISGYGRACRARREHRVRST